MKRQHQREFATSDEEFAQHVNQYSQRQLSNNEDALDAIRAVLARNSCVSCWGIPLSSRFPTADLSQTLGIELRWDKGPGQRSFRRRSYFPSWSWTGWSGSIRLSWAPGSWNVKNLNSGSDIQISVALHNGSSKTISEIHESAGRSKIIKELSHELLIQANFVRIRLQPEVSSTEFSIAHENAIRLRFCERHPDTICKIEDSCQQWETQSMFNLYLNHPHDRTEINHLWDAILLPTGSSLTRLLILDWHGDFAHRVGLIEAVEPHLCIVIRGLPRSWRTV